MEAVGALQQVLSVQRAFEVIAAIALTAYLFPRQAQVHDHQEFDMIVVGAGSAGTVVALRLAECNFKVLLVEAGGDPPLESLIPVLFPYLSHTDADWNYTNVRKNYEFQCNRERTINLTTGHVLGGGSSINYMFYVRGCRGDFAHWAHVANDTSWDYDGLLPLFKKSERLESNEILSSRYRKYHGRRGFLGVTREQRSKIHKYLEAFQQLGHSVLLDVNGDQELGYTPQLYTIADGVRQSTAYSILAQYKNPNLKVLKHTFVTEILFDENNNAVGVKAQTKDNSELILKARKEVILSAGAFNTPRLLMTSGIGPVEHLQSFNIPIKKDLPVGKNLQDHVPIILLFNLEESNEPPPPIDSNKFPFPAFTGYVALNESQLCPTYQAINFLIPAGSKSPVELCAFNYGFEFDICQNLYTATKNKNIMYTTLSLLHPESRGEVLLRSSDSRDPPVIDVGYFRNKIDLEVLIDSAIDFVQVLNTTYFRSVNAEMVDLKLESCKNLPYMSREWWRCYITCTRITLYHYSGTCALGSVVDKKLRVFGVGRLRVVDASVMPTLVGANTNAAVIAIGEKGADIICRDYSCSSCTFSRFDGNKFPNWQSKSP